MAPDPTPEATESALRTELISAGKALLSLRFGDFFSSLWRATLALFAINPRVFAVLMLTMVIIVVGGRLMGLDVLYFVPAPLTPYAISNLALFSGTRWIGESPETKSCISRALSLGRPYVILSIVDHITYDAVKVAQSSQNADQIIEILPAFRVDATREFHAEPPSIAVTSGASLTNAIEVHRRFFYTVLALRDISLTDQNFNEWYTTDRDRPTLAGARYWRGPFVENSRPGHGGEYYVQFEDKATNPVTLWTGSDFDYVLPLHSINAFGHDISPSQDFFEYPDDDKDVICQYTMAIESSTLALTEPHAHHLVPGKPNAPSQETLNSIQQCRDSTIAESWQNILPGDEVGIVFSFKSWQEFVEENTSDRGLSDGGLMAGRSFTTPSPACRGG
jgi:hypothetical protein